VVAAGGNADDGVDDADAPSGSWADAEEQEQVFNSLPQQPP